MADYNVNMKQWNGTSFDNVLPLAYNSHNAEQLGGQSLEEVQQWVKQWVQDNNLLLYSGQYVGDGNYGLSNPTSVIFPFAPSIFFFPNQIHYPSYSVFCGMVAISTLSLSSSYTEVRTPENLQIYMKKSSDGKTITWYSDSAEDQMNYSGDVYYYSAIGGNDIGWSTEFIITESGNFIVPRTGRYMLELYGGGGGTSRRIESSGYTGGASCQHYDSVSLTEGATINIVVGSGSKGQKAGETTSFGSYSVPGGGGSSTSVAGSGAGNYGAAGKHVNRNKNDNSYGTGKLSTTYGFGASTATTTGGDGAVYLKYLGA